MICMKRNDGMMIGKWHGGKGDARRKPTVSQQTVDDNWDRIFGKKKNKTEESKDESKD